MNVRNFNQQYAWAKQIDGGYQIVSVTADPYYSTTLPTVCDRTGLRCFENAANVDLILGVRKRAGEQLGLLNDRLKKAFAPLFEQMGEIDGGLQKNPNDAELQTKQLVVSLVGAAMAQNVQEELEPWFAMQVRFQNQFIYRLNRLCNMNGRSAGLDIPEPGPRVNPIIQTILALSGVPSLEETDYQGETANGRLNLGDGVGLKDRTAATQTTRIENDQLVRTPG